MNILLTGQCTLHWGRMEFGNIGNYYIIEPLVRELRRVFPNAALTTTFQMSQRFCDEENVSKVSMELYYGWTGSDLKLAEKELEIAQAFAETGEVKEETGFIKEVMRSDLIIDFSGDIWGDNANILGENRFLVGLTKNRVAQLFGKKVVMLAGSPGPFSDTKLLGFAREVYNNFDLVTNREPLSSKLLERKNFEISKTMSLACPAFLFEPADGIKLDDIIKNRNFSSEMYTVGFVLCGWNFISGPFDKENRPDSDFSVFVEAIEYITEVLGAQVCLMSHSNGFDIPPEPFELKHGRDYSLIKQLQRILSDRGISRNFYLLDGVYDAWETKAIIGCFDMLVSGRVHAAVAGLSQLVPTVIIDYGHEPKAHKLNGFAEVAQVKDYVADPNSASDLKSKILSCFDKCEQYRTHLERRIPEVQNSARQNFTLLREVMDD